MNKMNNVVHMVYLLCLDEGMGFERVNGCAVIVFANPADDVWFEDGEEVTERFTEELAGLLERYVI